MNRFQTEDFWHNEADVCMQYASLCLKFPSMFQEGKARDPEYWKRQAREAKETAEKVRLRTKLKTCPAIAIF